MGGVGETSTLGGIGCKVIQVSLAQRIDMGLMVREEDVPGDFVCVMWQAQKKGKGGGFVNP